MNEEVQQTTPQLTTPELKSMKTAFLVGTYGPGMTRQECESNVQELERLCQTYGLEVVGSECCPYKKLDAGTFIGSGKVEEIKEMAKEVKADVVIFDDEISPRQQRNLEKEIARPVIDRTELIIEVFAQRAQTKEARVQIELAKVRYQIPRLKRLWTHLSRQSAGGGAYLKGEGEKQIEIDRRLLKRRIERLFNELKAIRAQRETQRAKRLRTGVPTFAIVGYTNAGKSTLLKALTQADVLVEDKLFATLDTKTKKYTLPNGQEILLIDTVGFIRKIPHTLVAAFRSTLEEVIYTDILLHLIDASSPVAEHQAEETHAVLKELKALDRPIITVLNKIDQCEVEKLYRLRSKYPKTVLISALTGEGFSDLMELMQQELSNLRQLVNLKVPQSHYALVSELTREGKIISIEYEENDILIKAQIPTQLMHKVAPFIIE
jgi:GTPase